MKNRDTTMVGLLAFFAVLVLLLAALGIYLHMNPCKKCTGTPPPPSQLSSCRDLGIYCR
jgi:hypothetical protein